MSNSTYGIAVVPEEPVHIGIDHAGGPDPTDTRAADSFVLTMLPPKPGDRAQRRGNTHGHLGRKPGPKVRR